MKTRFDEACDPERISALIDGQLRGDELAGLLRHTDSSEMRECWHLYHLVGDVLRSAELASGAGNPAFVQRLSARLDPIPRPTEVSAPAIVAMPDHEAAAANDSVFRWKMVAGLASFAAVAALGWSVAGGMGVPLGGAQLAQVAPSSGPAVKAVATLSAPLPMEAALTAADDNGPVMLRDPRLDELLAAHRQATGASALGHAAGFLRNATFEGAGR